MEFELDEAKNTYTEAKQRLNRLSSDSGAESAEATATAQQEMDEALSKVEELRLMLDSMEIKSPGKGAVMESFVETHTHVEAGDQVFLIDPQDHFYLFNKSLAIFSFVVFWVFLAIHLLAR